MWPVFNAAFSGVKSIMMLFIVFPTIKLQGSHTAFVCFLFHSLYLRMKKNMLQLYVFVFAQHMNGNNIFFKDLNKQKG